MKDLLQNIFIRNLKCFSLPTLLSIALTSVAYGAPPNPDEAYKLHGYDIKNTANTSPGTTINKQNVNDLEIKWIYNIDSIPVGSPTNPANNYRLNNHSVSGVATDLLGRVYVHLGDGRTLILKANNLDGTNPDGTGIPKVLRILDLFSDPKYQGPPAHTAADPDNPERYDVYTTRLHPSIIGRGIYAANWSASGAANELGWANKLVGVPNPTDPNYRKEGGAILYKIDRISGNLIWKTVIDDDPRSAVATGSVTTPSLFHPLIFVPFSSIITGHLLGFDIYNTFTPGVPPTLPDDIAEVYKNNDFNNRGGLAAINKYTGKVVWKVYTLPQQDPVSIVDVINNGSRNQWTGASSWGAGTPAISKKLNMVYFGSGEAATSTDAADACEIARLADPTEPNTSDECIDYNQDGTAITGPLSDTIVEASSDGSTVRSPTHPLMDSVIAVDMDSGDIKWARRLNGLDAWNASCFELALDFPTFSRFINLFPPDRTALVGAVFGFNAFSRIPDPDNPGLTIAGPNQDPLCPLVVREDNLKIQASIFSPEFIPKAIPDDYRGLLFKDKDFDVGEQPMLVENVTMANGQVKDVLLVTLKLARVVALDASDGSVLWAQQFGFGDLFGDGFIWGSATDGKRFYSNTGRSSSIVLDDLFDTDPNNPNLSLTNKVVIDSCPVNGFNADDEWTGGSYVAVDIASGNVSWQRCVTAKELDDETRLPTGNILAGRSQAGVSVANGVVLAPGASTYDPSGSGGALATVDNPLAEVLLLDADSGELLRALPLQVEGEKSANTLVYQRPIAIGSRIFITNGGRRENGSDSPEDAFNRVVMYELSTPSKEALAEFDEYGNEIKEDAGG